MGVEPSNRTLSETSHPHGAHSQEVASDTLSFCQDSASHERTFLVKSGMFLVASLLAACS